MVYTYATHKKFLIDFFHSFVRFVFKSVGCSIKTRSQICHLICTLLFANAIIKTLTEKKLRWSNVVYLNQTGAPGGQRCAEIVCVEIVRQLSVESSMVSKLVQILEVLEIIETNG